MNRWLVTGSAGMLGQDLVAALRRGHKQVTGLTRQDLDIADREAVLAAARMHEPESYC